MDEKVDDDDRCSKPPNVSRTILPAGNRMSKDNQDAPRVEALIEEREERSRESWDNFQVAIVEHSADTSILFCNRQALKLLGLEKDAATGRIASDPRWIFHREDGTKMPLEEFPVVRVRNTLEPLQDYLVGVEQPDSQEIRWVLTYAYPQFDGEKALKTILVTFLDITKRKQAEQEREKALKLLQQALHEIKTLKGIIPICSYCKKIRDEEGSWEQLESYITQHSAAHFSHGICPECLTVAMKDAELD